MNEKYYAIGDIHGQSGLLKKALDVIYSEGGKTVIFLGDYIDRGPDSKGVLDIVMNPPEGVEFITLMGNHERMFIDSNFKAYFCGKFLSQTSGFLPENYKLFLKNLLPMYVFENNIFAHAFFDPTKGFDEQSESTLIWSRFYVGEDFASRHYHLTHGHTPFRNGPEQLPNRSNLDCSAKDGEQLCVGIYKKGYKGPTGFVMVYSDKEPVWIEPYYRGRRNESI